MATIDNAAEIKSLRTRLNKAKAATTYKKEELESCKVDYKRLITTQNDIEAKLKKSVARNKEITVTDHAIVRYLQRYTDLNVADVRKTIMSDKLLSIHKTLGNGEIPIGTGGVAVIKDNIIVTIK